MSLYNIFNNILGSTIGSTSSGAVSSVAGKTGAVSLVSTDISNFQPTVSLNTDVVNSKNKTQKLDQNGNINDTIIPSVNLSYSLGNPTNKLLSTYTRDLIVERIQGTTVGPNSDLELFNQNLKGIVIADGMDGSIKLTSNKYSGVAPNSKTGQVLRIADDNGTIEPFILSSGSGDVSGPNTSTPDAFCIFNDSTGKIIKNSDITYDQLNNQINARRIFGTLFDSIEVHTDIIRVKTLGIPTNLEITNDQGQGIILEPGQNGVVNFTGVAYNNATGKYLKLIDQNGKIGVGGPVIDAPTNTSIDAIPRFSNTAGQIKNSVVGINDSGFILNVQNMNFQPNATIYGSNLNVNCYKISGNSFLTPQGELELTNSQNQGIAIKNDATIRFTGANYTGSNDLVLTVKSDGSISRTQVIVDQLGTLIAPNLISSGYITAQQALRSNNILNLTNTASLSISDNPQGSITLNGSDYQNKQGRLLSFINNTGSIGQLPLVGPGTLRIDANGNVSVLLDPPPNPIATPHNLTSTSSDPNFIVMRSSVVFNDEGNYGGWRCFDDQVFDSAWHSAQNTYDPITGIQTTGAIAPMPNVGSWVGVVFSTDKAVSKIRMKNTVNNIPVDFSVARWDGTNWINTGFAVSNASQATGVYIEYNIPVINGGVTGLWRGIAIIVSRVVNLDANNDVSIKELDFQ